MNYAEKEKAKVVSTDHHEFDAGHSCCRRGEYLSKQKSDPDRKPAMTVYRLNFQKRLCREASGFLT